ncbi:MAG: Uncharacterised protein [Marinobacterium sp. xm-d-530]|jgi:intracellular sulfur oxidation DsrE/DsrF family protein|nr:MAG: Uncharacterised protein [Marinobacterium sp. xm-d-530]
MKKTLFLATALISSSAIADTQRLAIHVDENDPKVMNLALNNAQNVKAYYSAKGDDVIVELVAYGPGLNMYLENSPVKERLETLGMDESFKFSACNNTYTKMSKKAGKDLVLLSEAKKVPSGVVRLMELQKEGYAYLRP